MLDQSFSTTNFRKIFDIENRKGNYLEGDFFPIVENYSQLIQSCRRDLHQLKKEKSEIYDQQKQDLSDKLKELKSTKEELLNVELNKVSCEARAKGFSFGIREIDVGKPNKVFVAKQTATTFFSLKQIQLNILRLYKVKQGNRHQIVCQLRELLADSFPKYILRTDIASFYESIPREALLKKLRDDPLLTLASKKMIRRILSEYRKLTEQDVGLPRGIGVSAYLAELYMREIDSAIRDYPGVSYYARYVDDIFIIFCPPPNIGTFRFRRAVINAFKKLDLNRNRKKTEIICVPSRKPSSIEYLGYKFEIDSDKVVLRMTDKKVKRYKERMDLTFSAYIKQSKRSEKKARSLLERRIKFLTGNTRLVNNKKNVVSGIFFSNTLLTCQQDLVHLDHYLKTKISSLNNKRLKNRLLKHSFVGGFEEKRYYKFSTQDLSRIVEVWKHAS